MRHTVSDEVKSYMTLSRKTKAYKHFAYKHFQVDAVISAKTSVEQYTKLSLHNGSMFWDTVRSLILVFLRQNHVRGD